MARIKRGSQSYHRPSVAEQRAAKDYKPGEDVRSVKGEAAKQAQITRETKAHNERKAKEKKKSQRAKHRARVVAAKKAGTSVAARKAQRARASVGGIKDDPSNTKGETKPKRIGKVRKAFGRVGLRAMVLSGGGGGGAGRK